jgi:hypothetical protein
VVNMLSRNHIVCLNGLQAAMVNRIWAVWWGWDCTLLGVTVIGKICMGGWDMRGAQRGCTEWVSLHWVSPIVFLVSWSGPVQSIK